ncbi:MAG: ATP-binding protein, partial [Ruminiclostridium sp.]|nr:ATP-binding protein [Ruminiclostridium sp.]
MAGAKVVKVTEQAPVPEYNSIISGCRNALQVVDDIVLKNYISKLSSMNVVPLDKETLEKNIDDNVLFFKINEIVYEKDEFASYKFASVFNSLAVTKSAFYVIIDSDGTKTDFYMGVRSFDEERTTSSLKNILENSMFGQFPGLKTTNYTIEEIHDILDRVESTNISSVSCVANSRVENLNKNTEFVQGLEKLVLSMRGKKYTGIIIANTTEQEQLRALRRGYENIYTKLSPFASMQINYGQNFSFGTNESNADGTNESITETIGVTNTIGITETEGTTTTH